MKYEDRQPVRLGIEYYINGGWAVCIQAPYIISSDIKKIQGVIADYLEEAKLTGGPDPYAESSSPYTHHVQVYHLDNQPKDIWVFLNTLYGKILAVGFRNPEDN